MCQDPMARQAIEEFMNALQVLVLELEAGPSSGSAYGLKPATRRVLNAVRTVSDLLKPRRPVL